MQRFRQCSYGVSCAIIVALAAAAVAAGCAPQPSLYDRCGSVCAACGVGYCVAGGGSGHCSTPSRAECIVAAAGNCAAVTPCISDPDDYALCGATCRVCGIADCVAADRSGHCADPARAWCVVVAGWDIAGPEDCEAIRSCCIAALCVDAGSADAGAVDAPLPPDADPNDTL